MGYLGNGLTITGTQNSKRIVVDATPNQTISTVTGGYLIGQLDVYRNGVKLVDTQDYTASDGSSVTFLNAVSEGDELEFVVFENFDVANALSKSGGSLNGDLVVTGIATFNSDVSIGGTLTYEDVTNIDSVGIITARSFVSIADSIVHTGDENTSIRFPAADTFTVETAGNERLRINSAGLVAVGGSETVSAATGIQIENAGAALLTLLRNDLTISDGNTLGGIDFYGNDGGSVEQVAKISAVADGTHGDSDKPTALVFQTTNDGAGSATEKLRITNSGRVGIGTDNPLDELHVNSSSANVNLRLTRDLNNGARITGSDGASPAFIVETIASGTATERLRVDNNGRLGVGTVGPTHSLHVYDATDNSAQRNDVQAYTGGITIQNQAEVLDAFAALRFNFHGDDSYYLKARRIANNNGEFEIGQNYSSTSTDNIAIKIDNTLNVGIGTTIVRNSLKLDVEGAIGAGDGTTSNVSFANFDDPNSGMYFPAADQLGLVVGGSRKLFINSSGLTLNNGDLTLNNNDILGTGGINITGIVTATSYRGDGSQLSGISVGVTTHVGTASGIVTSVFLDDATDHKVTVTGFVTFTTTQSGTEGESHTLRIVNSGIATVGFSTYFLFPSGSVPVLPTADGAVSLISFTIHDSVGAGCTQLLAGASLNFSN